MSKSGVITGAILIALGVGLIIGGFFTGNLTGNLVMLGYGLIALGIGIYMLINSKKEDEIEQIKNPHHSKLWGIL